MGYKIYYKKKSYPNNHIIKEFGDFLLSNSVLFDIFIQLMVELKDDTEKFILLANLLNQYYESGLINDHQKKNFGIIFKNIFIQ